MELFQFRHSAFCEKVHLLLAAKGLSYSVKDVTPGVGQIELFQLTGQASARCRCCVMANS